METRHFRNLRVSGGGVFSLRRREKCTMFGRQWEATDAASSTRSPIRMGVSQVFDPSVTMGCTICRRGRSRSRGLDGVFWPPGRNFPKSGGTLNGNSNTLEAWRDYKQG